MGEVMRWRSQDTGVHRAGKTRLTRWSQGLQKSWEQQKKYEYWCKDTDGHKRIGETPGKKRRRVLVVSNSVPREWITLGGGRLLHRVKPICYSCPGVGGEWPGRRIRLWILEPFWSPMRGRMKRHFIVDRSARLSFEICLWDIWNTRVERDG